MNQHLGSRLLYRGATGFEKALADVDSHRITEIDAELIRAVWDPEAVPLDLLQYLAWAMGVQYWNDDWSETTKRTWVANQWLFKSIRGTKAGLEMAVRFAGRDVSKWGYEVTKVTTRPQRVYSGPTMTRAQREDWLSRLPQVRTWRVRESGFASPFKSFYNSSSILRMHDRRFCLGGVNSGEADNKASVAIPSDAILRLNRRARWVENGVETDIRVTNFGSYFQLHKTGVEGGRVFSDRPFGLSRYFVPSDAWKRLISIEPKSPSSWRNAITPTLQAITSEPERIKVSGTKKFNVFSGTPLRDFFVPTTAPLRIFWRYAVLDQSVRSLRRTPVQFMGTGRYGFPAFTAWADVTVGKVLPKVAAGFGFWIPSRKFYLPHDGKPLAQVRMAAQTSKALRDKILLRIGPLPKFRAGDGAVLAGIDTMLAN